MGRLHALTMDGPWAWSIFHLERDVENRTWAPPQWLIGQWLAIHAGPADGWSRETWMRVVAHAPRMRDAPSQARDAFLQDRLSPSGKRDRDRYASNIIGVVRITGIRRPLAVKRFLKGWWDTARFGLELSDAVEFRQGVPSKGTQSPLLWLVRGQVLEAVREEYRHAVSTRREPRAGET